MVETRLSSLINREAALDRVGGDEELLAEIARLFLEDYPRMVADIRDAIAAGDALGLEHAAHSLKGSVANFSADPARDAAFELEKIGRSKNLSLARAAFERFQQVFDA